MIPRIEYADRFLEDIKLQAAWYVAEAGSDIALKYAAGVQSALSFLSRNPQIGKVLGFRHRELRGLRLWLLDRPFHTHLVFYRASPEVLVAFRVMSGFRNLEKRLRQPPGAD